MPLPPLRTALATGPSSAAAGLTVVDYRSPYLTSGPADAAGLMSVTFEPVPPGYLWLIQRATVSTTSTAATRAMMYAGAPSPQNFVDGTNSGNLDISDENAPIMLDSSTQLLIQWTGATPGATGTARIQYQLVQRA